jgi:hypothetical protein
MTTTQTSRRTPIYGTRGKRHTTIGTVEQVHGPVGLAAGERIFEARNWRGAVLGRFERYSEAQHAVVTHHHGR